MCVLKPIIMFDDDEDDYKGGSGDETVIMAMPSRSPTKTNSPSKRPKPRSNCHSVAAILLSAEPSTIKIEVQGVCTCREKRKCDEEIVAVESQAKMSNVCNQEPEPLKKMTRQMKAQLGHQAAAKVSPCNISFNPITMRLVDAKESIEVLQVPWLRSTLWQLSAQQEGLHQLLDNADLLVKAFDSACETVGWLSKLVCKNYEAIDAVVHDTVEYKGCAIAKESLITDVSAINRILDIFDTYEFILFLLANDDLCQPQERFSRVLVANVPDNGVNMESFLFEKTTDGDADTEGDQDPDLV
ncbi:hypothetical protein ARMSODRAFT_974233 [Armillaria solidipes]|uniref:Uncharacterized protein n=1 Tax=Armillaria solidipes TaxID=1076256 RepID=A0A2H3C2H1_9AGAR|nr:hypothetical protein ARMSODRAFT_974233 [Armillaria solidipes]